MHRYRRMCTWRQGCEMQTARRLQWFGATWQLHLYLSCRLQIQLNEYHLWRYYCTCHTGYTYNPQTISCEGITVPVIQATHTTHRQSAVKVLLYLSYRLHVQPTDNQLWRYYCTCHTGYTYNPQTISCEGITVPVIQATHTHWTIKTWHFFWL